VLDAKPLLSLREEEASAEENPRTGGAPLQSARSAPRNWEEVPGPLSRLPRSSPGGQQPVLNAMPPPRALTGAGGGSAWLGSSRVQPAGINSALHSVKLRIAQFGALQLGQKAAEVGALKERQGQQQQPSVRGQTQDN
jgi:hypothetical protein